MAPSFSNNNLHFISQLMLITINPQRTDCYVAQPLYPWNGVAGSTSLNTIPRMLLQMTPSKCHQYCTSSGYSVSGEAWDGFRI